MLLVLATKSDRLFGHSAALRSEESAYVPETEATPTGLSLGEKRSQINSANQRKKRRKGLRGKPFLQLVYLPSSLAYLNAPPAFLHAP